MIVGMDFGTTNTGAAIFQGDSIRLLPLDPASSTPTICRTTLYLTRTGDYHLGSEAINLYFNQNIGRPTRFKKIKVGEILQVFAELPPFYRDVFVFEDEFSPGRLFVSIKTALRNPAYYGTVFQDHWYSASDLVAIFLIGMRMRMEKVLHHPVKEIVLGRPVHFSSDPTEDLIAQSRLLEAAFKAGFEKVYLEYEPVAAALSYERELKDKETVLVFDFGGGTLDFTVMEVGNPKSRLVYATGGIPIAGDIFDQRLFRASIPKHLGENDYFLSNGSRYPIPAHIFDLLSTPQEVLSLNTPSNLEMLRGIHQGSIHKEKTRRLLQVVSSNYALLLFDLVEKAKRELSEKVDTTISFKSADFTLEEPITRTRFQQAIRKEYEAIRQELDHTLERSGIRPTDIDRVIRTGGSSQIPLFVHMLNDVFGWQKVRQIDIFGSVTSGLSVRGWEIAAGKAELQEYTPSSFHGQEGLSDRQQEKPEWDEIDLRSVSQRLEVAVEMKESPVVSEQDILFLATGDRFHIFPVNRLDAGQGEIRGSDELRQILRQPEAVPVRVAYSRIEDHLLLATNLFKLIFAPARSIFLASQAGSGAVADLIRLDHNERITSLLTWDTSIPAPRYLCLITTFGQGRAFDARLMIDQLSKTPFFQLEKRYNGIPMAMLPATEEESLLVGTRIGRVGCVRASEMAIIPYELLKARQGEYVQAAAAFPPGERLAALSEAGMLLPVDPPSIPTGGSPASRGLVLRRNFPIAGFLRFPLASEAQPGARFALSSHARFLRLPELPEKTPGSSPMKALRLEQGEQIISLL